MSRSCDAGFHNPNPNTGACNSCGINMGEGYEKFEHSGLRAFYKRMADRYEQEPITPKRRCGGEGDRYGL